MKKASRFLDGPTLPVHIFGAGDAEQILRIESWRLQKFLSGKRYQLTPSGRIGKGRQGSRRVFLPGGLVSDRHCRFSREGWLFSPSLLGQALQFIENSDLLSFGERVGNVHPWLVLFAGKRGWEFLYAFRSARWNRNTLLHVRLGTNR